MAELWIIVKFLWIERLLSRVAFGAADGFGFH
jgi:hypothetical protein